jgi:hypothetical protein
MTGLAYIAAMSDVIEDAGEETTNIIACILRWFINPNGTASTPSQVQRSDIPVTNRDAPAFTCADNLSESSVEPADTPPDSDDQSSLLSNA